MSADDLASLLRLLGFPLMTYGLVALLIWNARTAPQSQAESPRGPNGWPKPEAGVAPSRSILKALRSTDQPKPRTTVVVCLGSGMLMTFAGLMIGILA